MINRDSTSYKWVVLALLTVAGAGGFFALDVMPPLFLEIQTEIALTATQMGAIIAAFHARITDLYAHRRCTGRSNWPATRAVRRDPAPCCHRCDAFSLPIRQRS